MINNRDAEAERQTQITNIKKGVKIFTKKLKKFTQSKLNGQITVTDTQPVDIRPTIQLNIKHMLSFKTNGFGTTAVIEDPTELLNSK